MKSKYGLETSERHLRRDQSGSQDIVDIVSNGGYEHYEWIVHGIQKTVTVPMLRGLVFESSIMEFAARVWGWGYEKVETAEFFIGEWSCRSTADFWCWKLDTPEERFLVDIKSHDWRIRDEYGDEGSGEVPGRIGVQAQAHCFAYDVPKVVFVCMFGGNEPEAFHVIQDEESWRRICSKVLAFKRKNLDTKTPPKDNGTDESYRVLSREPTVEGSLSIANKAEERRINVYINRSRKIKKLQLLQKSARGKLNELIVKKGVKGIACQNGSKISRTKVKNMGDATKLLSGKVTAKDTVVRFNKVK